MHLCSKSSWFLIFHVSIDRQYRNIWTQNQGGNSWLHVENYYWHNKNYMDSRSVIGRLEKASPLNTVLINICRYTCTTKTDYEDGICHCYPSDFTGFQFMVVCVVENRCQTAKHFLKKWWNIVCNIPETSKSRPPGIAVAIPKRKRESLPTIYFQLLCLRNSQVARDWKSWNSKIFIYFSFWISLFYHNIFIKSSFRFCTAFFYH